MELISENAVITAAGFNPSVFSQHFLIRIGLAQEEQFGPVIMTPALCQLSTPRYEILVTPDRLQFVPKGDDDASQSFAVREVLGHIVEQLPHTPYTAAGLNFILMTPIPEEQSPAITRRLFSKGDSVLANEFDSDDAKFGAYFSKDIFGARLRLNISPGKRSDNGAAIIQASFNFDKPVPPENSIQPIRDMLGQWEAAKEYARRVSLLIENAR